NLVKLSFEHRHKVIGARFKAKLVLTFLALALTPGILIFIIASNFITTSIEGWFKPQVERPLDQAMEVAQTYYQTLESTALRRGPDGLPVGGATAVGLHVPPRREARPRGISQAFQEYKQLKLLKNPIKGIYILLCLLMTLIIVFSATWFGLYLARGITDPIQKLAEGTREVAAGNLQYKVEVRADDEIGILVDSRTRTTGGRAASQAKLEETYRDLQAKHNEVAQRRHY